MAFYIGTVPQFDERPTMGLLVYVGVVTAAWVLYLLVAAVRYYVRLSDHPPYGSRPCVVHTTSTGACGEQSTGLEAQKKTITVDVRVIHEPWSREQFRGTSGVGFGESVTRR